MVRRKPDTQSLPGSFDIFLPSTCEKYTRSQIYSVAVKIKDVKQWTVESKKRKLMMKKRKEERGIEGSAVIVEEQTAGRP